MSWQFYDLPSVNISLNAGPNCPRLIVCQWVQLSRAKFAMNPLITLSSLLSERRNTFNKNLINSLLDQSAHRGVVWWLVLKITSVLLLHLCPVRDSWGPMWKILSNLDWARCVRRKSRRCILSAGSFTKGRLCFATQGSGGAIYGCSPTKYLTSFCWL